MLTLAKTALVEVLAGQSLKRRDIAKDAEKFGIPNTQLNWIVYASTKQSDGTYLIPGLDAFEGKKTRSPKIPKEPEMKIEAVVPFAPKTASQIPEVSTEKSGNLTVKSGSLQETNLVPTKDPLFVKFGVYSDVLEIIKSGMFYPVYVTGLSGNGKTYSITQACAAVKREVIRVNITCETDEDDLIGGFRLLDGDTVFVKGPVLEAMNRGSILLLDEIDLGTNKLMCLQSILEGSGYFVKKTGEYVKPAPGFNIIATANTKGRGDETGKFIGTGILNEAFLERFPVTMFQEYPTPAVETRILNTLSKSIGLESEKVENFIGNLVKWASGIRKTFDDGGIEEVITTRRLVNIMKAYQIFGKEETAIKMCVARFDNDTSKSFVELYQKIAGVQEKVEAAPEIDEEESSPF